MHRRKRRRKTKKILQKATKVLLGFRVDAFEDADSPSLFSVISSGSCFCSGLLTTCSRKDQSMDAVHELELVEIEQQADGNIK